MNDSFNLIDQNWIPCTHFDGRMEEFSLKETLLRAHELRDIQGDSPLETAALYRLLLAVLHGALRGPQNRSEWIGLWERCEWDPKLIDGYLSKWHDRFDLFHPEKPFYQTKDERMAQKPAVQIAHGMGTANELFEHTMVTEDVAYRCNQVARLLLVGQAFGLGGLCHPQLKIFLTNAPLTRGIVFLVEGHNLFETLMLNLIRYAEDRPLPTIGEDKPVWEWDNPFIPTRQQPCGYLDYLTWQNRKFLLIPEKNDAGDLFVRKFQISNGLPLSDVLDPQKQYTKKDKGWRPWVFTENRSLWRDCNALFRMGDPDTDHPPQSFIWLSSLVGEDGPLDYKQTYHYMALGTGMHYKDAKIFFYRQEHMPLPLSYLANPDLVGRLSSALIIVEEVKSKLWGATNTLAKLLLSPNSDAKEGHQPDPKDIEKLQNYWNVERFYWLKLEIPFLHFLEDLPQDAEAATLAWEDIVQQVAWQALESAASKSGDDASALKAAVRARASLGYSLKKLFSETEKEITV